MSRTWTPRLSVEITEEQHQALQKALPHGTKKRVFSKLVDQLLVLVDHAGMTAIGGIEEGIIGIGFNQLGHNLAEKLKNEEIARGGKRIDQQHQRDDRRGTPVEGAGDQERPSDRRTEEGEG